MPPNNRVLCEAYSGESVSTSQSGRLGPILAVSGLALPDTSSSPFSIIAKLPLLSDTTRARSAIPQRRIIVTRFGGAELPSRTTLPVTQIVFAVSDFMESLPGTEAGLSSVCAIKLKEERRTKEAITYSNFIVLPLRKRCPLRWLAVAAGGCWYRLGGHKPFRRNVWKSL